MSFGRKLRTEHVGGKNGGGYWGHRVEAKTKSNRVRRRRDKEVVREQREGQTEGMAGAKEDAGNGD